MVVPWWGSVTGLTRHDVTIYLVPSHHNWSAKAKVITPKVPVYLEFVCSCVRNFGGQIVKANLWSKLTIDFFR